MGHEFNIRRFTRIAINIIWSNPTVSGFGPLQYGHLFIRSNPADDDQAGSSFSDLGSYGMGFIHIEGFRGQDRTFVQVNENTITATTNGATGIPGIEFIRSNGAIEQNSVTGPLNPGIQNVGLDNQHTVNSLICDNSIDGQNTTANTGLAVTNYTGYVKLGEIQNFQTGYALTADVNAVSNLIFSKIHDCGRDGILINSGSLDMTGLHHDPVNDATGDFAGFNSIHDNGSISNSVGGQIRVVGNSSNLFLTQTDVSNWSSGNAGLNNIFQGSSTHDAHLVLGRNNQSPNQKFNIDNNFWGGLTPTSNATPWADFYFSPSTAAIHSETTIPTSVSCGSAAGGALIYNGSKQKMQMLSVDSASCAKIPSWGRFYVQNSRDTEAYDTMRFYFNHCYMFAAPENDFGVLGAAAGDATIHRDSAKREFLNWMMTIIPLRNDAPWFCQAVWTLGAGYEDGDFHPILTIVKYLMDNPHCENLRPKLIAEYDRIRNSEFNIWEDTAKNRTQWDTTLPSMHDLGFDSVLKYANSVVDPPPAFVHLLPILLSEAKVIPNPAEAAADIVFSCSREAFVTIELRNMLGNEVLEVASQVLQAGEHEIPVDLHLLAAGTYYARIVTAYGEMRTVKIVKE